MKDNKKLEQLHKEVKDLINKYKTYYMTDEERKKLDAEIKNLQNSINCINVMK